MNQFNVNQEFENAFGRFNEAYQILLIMQESLNDVYLQALLLEEQPSPYALLNELNNKIYKSVPVGDVFSAYKALVNFDQRFYEYVCSLGKVESETQHPANYIHNLFGVSNIINQSVSIMEEAINYKEDIAA